MVRPSVALIAVTATVLVLYFLNISQFHQILGGSTCDSERLTHLERTVLQQRRQLDEAERRARTLQHIKDDILTELEEYREASHNSENTQFSANAMRPKLGSRLWSLQTPIGVLVLTYKRPDYLHKTLEYIFEYLPPENYVMVISQDGDHNQTKAKIDEWREKSRRIFSRDILHIQRLDRPDPPTEDLRVNKQTESYFQISQHYKFALSFMFDTLQLKSVIIIEDDIEISPDFFAYFERFQPMLLNDPTVYCVSAFHDNSRQGLVEDKRTRHDLNRTSLEHQLRIAADAVVRSHFFPGLGWMISRSLWNELAPKWPLAFWDDWMRANEQRLARDCIRPEVSRSITFGVEGASSGSHSTYYDLFWNKMIKNQDSIDWGQFPLEQLERDEFDRRFIDRVKSALVISGPKEIDNYQDKTLMIMYSTREHFEDLALPLGLMHEWTHQPRASYYNVVEFRRNGNVVILAPGNIESTIIDLQRRLQKL